MQALESLGCAGQYSANCSGPDRLIYELSAGAVSLPIIAVFTTATTGIPSGHFGSCKLENGMVGRRGGMTESILP